MNKIQQALAYAANIKNALGGVVDNAIHGAVDRSYQDDALRRAKIQSMMDQQGMSPEQQRAEFAPLPPNLKAPNPLHALLSKLGIAK